MKMQRTETSGDGLPRNSKRPQKLQSARKKIRPSIIGEGDRRKAFGGKCVEYNGLDDRLRVK